jgi:hypothetical protein
LQFHLSKIAELKKASLMSGKDACSAESDEEFFDRIEVHDAIREAGDCLDELVVGPRAHSDAQLAGGRLGPCGDCVRRAFCDRANLFIRERRSDQFSRYAHSGLLVSILSTYQPVR